jgi:hypothetical protein
MPAEKANPKKNKTATKKTVSYARWFPLIIILFSVLLYARTMKYQYVKMDDTDLIVENEVFIKHLKNIPQAFKQSCFEIPGHLTDNKSYYRPILMVSFMIDAQLHGVRSASTYHFFNLLYHILACLLLYYLLKKLSGNAGLSLLLALLFAVHPVNVHAVAWIPGRNDLLLAIFTLLSFIGLINYHKSSKDEYLVLHLVSFALAVFTKESGVLLLVLYPLFMWLWMGDISLFKKKIILPLTYAVITIAWFFARSGVMKGHEEIGSGASLINVVWQNIPYMFLYIGKVLLPFNLNVMPGVNTEAIVLGCISLLVLAILFYYIRDRRKMLFCLVWYFIFLAPTLLVPELPAYEHRDYLPLIGLLIGITQVSFLSGYTLKANKLTYICIAIAAVFFTISVSRLPVFADRFAFWTDGTEDTPFAASACVNVGQLYQEIYDHDQDWNALQQAGHWTKKALGEDSATLRGNNNYGAYLYLTGHKDEAAVYFQKEIKFHPTNTDAYKNMGIYFKEKGEPAKSVFYWKKLISLNRYYLTAYEDLANYYKQTGDMQQAQQYATKGQQLANESEKQYRKLE